jgi:hypothetical protein
MKLLQRWKYLFVCLGIILLLFVVASIFDILLVFIYPRFYSNMLFIVCFGVAGVFAAFIGYVQSIGMAVEKNEFARWSLIILMIVIGLFFFFPFAMLEGGEYKAAFKAYGLMLTLCTGFFMKGKVTW